MHFCKGLATLSLLVVVLPAREVLAVKSNVGDPLLLTPYILSGRIAEGRELARVDTKMTSFSGYFTVNQTYNSNLFFWFFPAENLTPRTPVILWLQGIPGTSSLMGLFAENGPFVINSANLTLGSRNTSWSKNYSMLYIDQPVGSGFSFTDHPEGFAKSSDEAADDLLNAIIQFFQLFPDYGYFPFFAMGEYYAGKVLPAFAVKLKESPEKRDLVNLKGLAIGNAFCGDKEQEGYGEYLMNAGLIGSWEKDEFTRAEGRIQKYVGSKKYLQAFEEWDKLIGGLLYTGPTYFQNVTGFNSTNNYVNQEVPPETRYYPDFLRQDSVRQALHVGNTPFNNVSKTVLAALAGDFFNTSRPYYEGVVSYGFRKEVGLWLYSGQLDLLVPNLFTEKFMLSLRKDFSTDINNVWRLNGTVAGYYKGGPYFRYVVVRDAGRLVPLDQPATALDMIYNLVN